MCVFFKGEPRGPGKCEHSVEAKCSCVLESAELPLAFTHDAFGDERPLSRFHTWFTFRRAGVTVRTLVRTQPTRAEWRAATRVLNIRERHNSADSDGPCAGPEPVWETGESQEK